MSYIFDSLKDVNGMTDKIDARTISCIVVVGFNPTLKTAAVMEPTVPS